MSTPAVAPPALVSCDDPAQKELLLKSYFNCVDAFVMPVEEPSPVRNTLLSITDRLGTSLQGSGCASSSRKNETSESDFLAFLGEDDSKRRHNSSCKSAQARVLVSNTPPITDGKDNRDKFLEQDSTQFLAELGALDDRPANISLEEEISIIVGNQSQKENQNFDAIKEDEPGIQRDMEGNACRRENNKVEEEGTLVEESVVAEVKTDSTASDEENGVEVELPATEQAEELEEENEEQQQEEEREELELGSRITERIHNSDATPEEDLTSSRSVMDDGFSQGPSCGLPTEDFVSKILLSDDKSGINSSISCTTHMILTVLPSPYSPYKFTGFESTFHIRGPQLDEYTIDDSRTTIGPSEYFTPNQLRQHLADVTLPTPPSFLNESNEDACSKRKTRKAKKKGAAQLPRRSRRISSQSKTISEFDSVQADQILDLIERTDGCLNDCSYVEEDNSLPVEDVLSVLRSTIHDHNAVDCEDDGDGDGITGVVSQVLNRSSRYGDTTCNEEHMAHGDDGEEFSVLEISQCSEGESVLGLVTDVLEESFARMDDGGTDARQRAIDTLVCLQDLVQEVLERESRSKQPKKKAVEKQQEKGKPNVEARQYRTRARRADTCRTQHPNQENVDCTRNMRSTKHSAVKTNQNEAKGRRAPYKRSAATATTIQHRASRDSEELSQIIEILKNESLYPTPARKVRSKRPTEGDEVLQLVLNQMQHDAGF